MKNKKIFSISETAEILVPDKLGRTSYLLAMVVMIVMIVLISLVITKLPPEVPLFFSLPWGEARLAPRAMLYLLPAILLMVILFNLGLGRLSTKLSPLLPRVLAVASAVIAFMLFVSMFGIVQSLGLI